MHRFTAKLGPGTKPPYDTWTFVAVPDDVYRALGQARPPVAGTVAGVAFRGTVNRSGGVPRLVVKRELLEQIEASQGDEVEVRIELDGAPRTVAIPSELANVFEADPGLAELYSELPPSLRRAWAEYVGEAKRAGTRARRAQKAPAGIRNKLYPNQ